MKSLKIPKAAGVFTRYVCRCLALMLILLYPLSAAATDKVRLQLKWPHQFQFAGYYAAQAQGYYQAVGLDVEIIPCQPGEDAVQKVLQGKAEFGVWFHGAAAAAGAGCTGGGPGGDFPTLPPGVNDPQAERPAKHP